MKTFKYDHAFSLSVCVLTDNEEPTRQEILYAIDRRLRLIESFDVEEEIEIFDTAEPDELTEKVFFQADPPLSISIWEEWESGTFTSASCMHDMKNIKSLPIDYALKYVKYNNYQEDTVRIGGALHRQYKLVK